MIIYYKKSDGKIIGIIEGRLHTDEHLKMHIGIPDENGKLVIEWEPTEQYADKDGNIVGHKWEPKHKQKELFQSFEKFPSLVYQYKVKDGMLIPL